MKNFRIHNLAALLIAASVSLVSCSSDDDNGNDVPPEENEIEVITDVTLVFSNLEDTTDVVRATAEDPDGEGASELVIADEITLRASATYELAFEVFNNLDPDDSEDIGAEILEEADEHQIFFGFTEGVFTTPVGDGNIDNASDAINYEDEDESGNPVGLETVWTTVNTASEGGEFTVRLQHQPDLKSATTGADDGDTDFDLTFVLNIQ